MNPVQTEHGLILRDASAEDAEALSNLAFRSKAYWGYPEEFMQACREELSVSAAYIDDPDLLYVIAEKNTRTLGYYALSKESRLEWELEALFVEPEYIGTGIGRLLMQHAKQTAAGAGVERILIQGDPHARRFYQAAGGVEIGRRESDSISGRYLPLFQIEIGSAFKG